MKAIVQKPAADHKSCEGCLFENENGKCIMILMDKANDDFLRCGESDCIYVIEEVKGGE